MKFASIARIVAMSWVNTCEMIRPTISRCSRLTFWCTITPSRMFWMITGGTMPSIWITKVARNRWSRIFLWGTRYLANRTQGDRDAATCAMSWPGVKTRQVPLQPRSNSSTLIFLKPIAGSATHTCRFDTPYTTT